METFLASAVAGTITGAIILAALVGAGMYLESNTRSAPPKGSQNNLAETDCDALCEQISLRHSEQCHAAAYADYTFRRMTTAAAAAAIATLAAFAASVAAAAVLATPLGFLVYGGLVAIAALAGTAAGVAIGAAGSATTAWMQATTSLNDARGRSAQARSFMTTACGNAQTRACINALPACP